MKSLDQATELARTMVELGVDAGVNISALLTNMDTPLGLTAGNALEVEESVEVLAGGGPKDVVDLTVALAEEMLRLAGKRDVDVRAALKDGRAMDRWNQMVRDQGGDPEAPLPRAKHSEVITASESGFLTRLDAWGVGVCAWRLGAGRASQGERVQAAAGVRMHAKPGDAVRAGDPLLTLYTDTPERFARSIEALDGAITIGAEQPEATPVVLEKILPETD